MNKNPARMFPAHSEREVMAITRIISAINNPMITNLLASSGFISAGFVPIEYAEYAVTDNPKNIQPKTADKYCTIFFSI